MRLNPLKIAIIGQYPNENSAKRQVFTGIMRVVDGLVQELRACSDIELEILAEGLKGSRDFVRILRIGLSFLGNLLRSRAEIFHMHGVSFPIFASLVIGKLKRKKTVYTAHGLVSREMKLGYHYSPLSLFYEFSLIRFSDHITTPSEKMWEMIVRDYHVGEEKISVIENGVNLSFFDENTGLEERVIQLQRIKGRYVILFVGGTRKVKGLLFLLESIKALRKKRKDMVLLIVGKKGDQHNALICEYSDLLQGGYVRFLGRIPERELKNIYGIADTITLPSSYEPFGLIVLEAMAKGKTVIVSDGVGASSIITNGKDGIIVPYGDVNHLAEEIDFLLQNRDAREQIGRNARKTAKEYTWNRVARKYVKCYRQLLLN